MAKSIKEIKKENVFLKSKCDKSDVTLIELVEEVQLTCHFKLSFFSIIIYFKKGVSSTYSCLCSSSVSD